MKSVLLRKVENWKNNQTFATRSRRSVCGRRV